MATKKKKPATAKKKAAKKAAPKAAPKRATPSKTQKTTRKVPAAPKSAPKAARPSLKTQARTRTAAKPAVAAPHSSKQAGPAKVQADPSLKRREAAPPKPVLRDPDLDLAQALAALALDKKADDVVILRVTDLTSYTDGFVLASAPSERQVQAIARHVDDEMRRAGKGPIGSEGMEQGHWVLVDFGAVVLHVFLASARHYYDLEGFWSDAPRVDADEAYGRGIHERMLAATASLAANA